MTGLRFVSKWMCVLAAVALIGACGDGESSPTGVGLPEDAVFDPALGVDLAQMTRLDGGLYIQDLIVGTGAEAGPGDTVRVYYSGWLPDGTLFDRNVTGPGFPFAIGQPLSGVRVIVGWDRGVAGMRVGGTRKLVIPATLGYGNSAVGSIPPNSVLVFDVELRQIGL